MQSRRTRLTVAVLVLLALIAPALAILLPSASASDDTEPDIPDVPSYTETPTISAWVVNPQDDDVDGLFVTATPVDGDEIAATAITYEGQFELYVEPGVYDVVVDDPSEGAHPYQSVAFPGVEVGEEDVTVGEDGTVVVSRGTLRADRAPALVKTTKLGATLTAPDTAWDVEVVKSYDWLRDGKVVRSGVSPAYKVGVADVGTALRVRVHAEAAGWYDGASLSSNSAAVAKVPGLLTARVTNPRWIGKGKARKLQRGVVHARVETTGPRAAGTVQLRAGAKVVATKKLNSKGQAVFQAPVVKAGTLRKLEVRYLGSRTVAVAKRFVAVRAPK